ncbi:EamA family transporter [Marivirga harenae]|uniref:DMT family transporter n=1 Tax=Marivirga harenae TaxID=2010992 RepID=UPI0026E059BD|nr:EamA family transporter [Marivirga harenae]WKV11325.1 EamA family transporter [Marivirga harenae]|tara:strand:+ start:69486 stop:70397 length:912 start_codon:yes stop_codon:yes gene_type:complete
MTIEAKNYLQLHFIVLIWGLTAILGLLINISAVAVVFYRTLFATVTLLFILYFWKLSFKVGFKEFLKILGVGLIIGLHWILFFAAARVSSASVCLVGIATCSFWTSLIEPLMSSRKIKIYELALGILVVMGLYIIFSVEFQYLEGLIMAIISAILASVFTVLNGKLTHHHNHYVITFYEMMGALIGSIILIPLYLSYFNSEIVDFIPNQWDWFYLIILAVICTVLAFSMSVKVQKVLSAFVVNLTVNLEPIYGIILAFLIFGEEEKMSFGFYVGTSIILLSVLCYPIVNRVMKRRALQSDILR